MLHWLRVPSTTLLHPRLQQHLTPGSNWSINSWPVRPVSNASTSHARTMQWSLITSLTSIPATIYQCTKLTAFLTVERIQWYYHKRRIFRCSEWPVNVSDHTKQTMPRLSAGQLMRDRLRGWLDSNRQSPTAARVTTLSVRGKQLLHAGVKHARTLGGNGRPSLASSPALSTLVSGRRSPQSDAIVGRRGHRKWEVPARSARRLDAHTSQHNEERK